MGNPSHGPADRENAGEGLSWKSQRIEQQRRVKFDINIKRTIRLALLEDCERRVLDGFRKVDPLAIDLRGQDE